VIVAPIWLHAGLSGVGPRVEESGREASIMQHVRGLFALLLALAITAVGASPSAAAPDGRADAPAGQMTWAVHISLAPSWFDPAETSGIITPSWCSMRCTTRW